MITVDAKFMIKIQHHFMIKTPSKIGIDLMTVCPQVIYTNACIMYLLFPSLCGFVIIYFYLSICYKTPITLLIVLLSTVIF